MTTTEGIKIMHNLRRFELGNASIRLGASGTTPAIAALSTLQTGCGAIASTAQSWLLALLFVFSTGAMSQSIVAGGSSAEAGEEKDFQGSSLASQTSIEACHQARERALNWLAQNTEKTNYNFLMNQARRGWVAKSGGTTRCECSKTSIEYICTTTAKLTRADASGGTEPRKRMEQSFLGVGFKQTSACDEAKNRASSFARSANKSVRTSSCECEARPGALNEAVWQCRVDGAFE